jgi:phage terminase large subunit
MPEVGIPEKLESLLGRDYQYYGAWGGRGGAKSETVATKLVIDMLEEQHLVMGLREIQGSIKDSSKATIEAKIKELEYEPYFDITDVEIRTKHHPKRKSTMIFRGVRTNPDSVKSTKGVTRAWAEEANAISQTSLDLILPTVMRENTSQFIASWNPDKRSDPVDALFRGNDDKNRENTKAGVIFEPPPGSIVTELHYYDNPWFPDFLRQQMEWDKRRDVEKYGNVWLGKYKTRSEARVFKNWRIEAFDYPNPAEDDTIFYQGGDWGFSVDPSVLVRCFIDEPARKLYVVDEAYAVGVDIDFLPLLFAGRDGANAEQLATWGPGMDAAWPGVPDAKRWRITADSARPETISYMQKRGFNIEAAKKGRDSVEEGVTFLQNYDIIVHPRCVHTIDELSFYSWKTDPKTNAILPVLADMNNHVIDALRYAVEGVANSDARMWAEFGRVMRGR